MFTGFQFKFPVYTVITPQSGLSFDVRALVTREIRALKTSHPIPSAAPEAINNTMFTCIQRFPDGINTIEDFKRKVTLLDREAILYGIYHMTFGDELDFSNKCQNCGEEFGNIKVDISKMFSMNAYPKSDNIINSYVISKAINGPEIKDDTIERAIFERNIKTEVIDKIPESRKSNSYDDAGEEDGILFHEQEVPKRKPKEQPRNVHQQPPVEQVAVSTSKSIIDERINIELPVMVTVKCVIKQPTLYDEEMTLKNLSHLSKKDLEVLYEIMPIDRFEEMADPNNVNSTRIYNTKEDIMFAYQELHWMDTKKIDDIYAENFGQYRISLKTDFPCTKCGHVEPLVLNMLDLFFRMVMS
jgi:hypothetical protein